MATFVVTFATTTALPGTCFAAAAVPVSISINRHPEPRRTVNWTAVHVASRQMDAARTQLLQAARDVRREVEESKEYATAIANVRAAHTAHQQAVAEASAAVETGSAYIDLDLRLQVALSTVEALHRSPQAHPEHVVAAAREVLRIRARATELRTTCLAGDPAVEAARYALIDAGTELRRLREEARSRIAQDSAWQSARRQFEVARKQYATAG